MMKNSNADIANQITDLLNKENAYVQTALLKFIHSYLKSINECCQKIKLDAENVIKLHQAFLDLIRSHHYTSSYTTKGFKRLDNYEVDEVSFNAFIYKKFPSLKSVEGFICEVLGINDKKAKVMEQIRDIKKIINQYSNDSKKEMINAFNNDVDAFLLTLNDKSYFDVVDQAKTRMTSLLDDIQTKETRHYDKFSFFKASRQSNSTLQPKINNAKEILAKLGVVEDKAAAKALSSKQENSHRNKLSF